MKISPRPNVLIVDDHIEYLQQINKILDGSKVECNVVLALSAKIALTLIEKQLPDLIITDWEMPHMSGIEFVKQLKADEKTADIPIILCTGIMTSSEHLDQALEAGAVDFVRKPIDEVELIARLKANLHLSEKYKEIIKLNELKNKIFSVIAHDLRGPMVNINSFIDIIMGQNTHDPETVELISAIKGQSTSVFNIFENLLSWARTYQGNFGIKPETNKINTVIQENIGLLSEMARKKDIQIINEVNDGTSFKFDRELISAVVRNLISNAIKFTRKGGTITITSKDTGNNLEVSILDTGIGIEPDRIDLIFDKTIHDVTYGTNYEKGTGLGLLLSQEFVEMHNGKIWVESKVGQGSNFRFTLPG